MPLPSAFKLTFALMVVPSGRTSSIQFQFSSVRLDLECSGCGVIAPRDLKLFAFRFLKRKAIQLHHLILANGRLLTESQRARCRLEDQTRTR